jgi:hypothetical protein
MTNSFSPSRLFLFPGAPPKRRPEGSFSLLPAIFIDLTGDFRVLPAAYREKLFLTGADSPFIGADGHYSEDGNAFVAQLLLKKMNDAKLFNN